ncbi:protein PHYTOCHROME KINASE SUBSTRATE 1-like [Vicia villosa]|uniref:protein PHYTOCHROME KINASE SUBSTRATE 1-like n=1 Tax=Vicia villosa TaxID=3911 RepID=UPI00273C1317|nr:protein PHYTOCHROME KINASE SUBSTRATE 1-like [Vicia villosa]
MTEESGEIEVFGAEKYFNRKVVETPRAATKYQVEYGTPSISSISTWNSQNALLKRDSEKSIKDKVHAKSVLSRLGLKCSCSDKNSVDISDHAGEISFNNKTSNYGAVHEKSTPKTEFNLGLDDDISIKLRKASSEFFINKDLYFQKQENLSVGLNSEMNSFPSNSRNHVVKMQFPLDEEKTPRKSVEVFGSPNPILTNSKRSSLSIDKRLIFSSKMEEIVDANYDDDDDDDAGSDASSDLFEIESLKEKSSNNLLNRRTSDAASTCYAPSEASVGWSVVTASAAVMSDCEDQMSEFTVRSPLKVIRENPRRSPGILLGCKSHKAVTVRVAGDAFITYEKQSLSPKIGNRIENNALSQVARFPGETDVSASERHV